MPKQFKTEHSTTKHSTVTEHSLHRCWNWQCNYSCFIFFYWKSNRNISIFCQDKLDNVTVSSQQFFNVAGLVILQIESSAQLRVCWVWSESKSSPSPHVSSQVRVQRCRTRVRVQQDWDSSQTRVPISDYDHDDHDDHNHHGNDDFKYSFDQTLQEIFLGSKFGILGRE